VKSFPAAFARRSASGKFGVSIVLYGRRCVMYALVAESGSRVAPEVDIITWIRQNLLLEAALQDLRHRGTDIFPEYQKYTQ